MGQLETRDEHVWTGKAKKEQERAKTEPHKRKNESVIMNNDDRDRKKGRKKSK
jgi:hypothetical protein